MKREKKWTLASPVNVSSEENVCTNMTFVLLKTLSPGLLQLVEKVCRPQHVLIYSSICWRLHVVHIDLLIGLTSISLHLFVCILVHEGMNGLM